MAGGRERVGVGAGAGGRATTRVAPTAEVNSGQYMLNVLWGASNLAVEVKFCSTVRYNSMNEKYLFSVYIADEV